MHKPDPRLKKIKLDKASERLYYGVFLYGKEKVTPARINVLAALDSFEKPVSIKHISQIVKDHNTSTLYRTLETLVAAGLVTKISVHPTESLYETNINRHHHHHITCTSCGTLEDIDVCAPLPSHKTLKTKGFSKITGHSLEFFGLCTTCTASV